MEYKHPEQQDGEVFLLNIKDNEDWGVPPFCESVRRGDTAYSTTGEVVPDMKPLFGKLKPIDGLSHKQKLVKQLKEALGYLENDKLLDLNDNVFICGLPLHGTDEFRGFARHNNELRVLTRQQPNGYPIDEIDSFSLFVIFEGSEYIWGETILSRILREYYQTNSL